MEVRNGQDFVAYLHKTINNNEARNTYNCGCEIGREAKYWNEYKKKCGKATKELGDDFWSIVEYINNNVE